MWQFLSGVQEYQFLDRLIYIGKVVSSDENPKLINVLKSHSVAN